MKPHSKTFNAVGIILKRSNVGEADKVISLLTQEYGKLVAVAKGVRKLSSSKKATLEPGNYVKAHFVATKSLPILTQAKLIDDCSEVRTDLAGIRRLVQFLEVIEKLFVEEELDSPLFNTILQLRQRIVTRTASAEYIKKTLGDIIESLGYQHPSETSYTSVLEYVSSIADKPMRSFEYLKVE